MASQQPFILNPSYSGPMVIAESLRKMKTNNGLNRMLSSYNKRFFVLDLNHCNFYYLPERGAHFSDATDIPLANVIGVRVTKQSEGLEEDKIWKHEFVLTTKKKSLELISDSKSTMDKFLYALANIINTKTNKPLFNWNHYTGAQDQTLSPSNLLSFKSPDASPQKQNEASFSSPERSPAENPTVQPEQRGELTPELLKIQQACKDVEENQQSPASSGSEKENKQNQEDVPKKYATLQHRRKGNSFAALRGKGFEVDKEERVMEKLASPVKEEVSPVKSRKDVMESLSPVKIGDKIQIKVEMLNFDKIEKEITKVEHNKVINSERESKKSNPGEQSVRRGVNRLIMNQKSASVRNMVGQDGDIMGCNQVDLSHQRTRVSKNSEGNSVLALASARRGESEKQMSFGTGLGQEVSKFSLLKNEKIEKVSVDVSVKKSANDDDDWDNEMFGDGKHQLSPLKPKNHELKQSKTMCSDKKSQLSQKRSEFVASRQGTYNDWDDEL